MPHGSLGAAGGAGDGRTLLQGGGSSMLDGVEWQQVVIDVMY